MSILGHIQNLAGRYPEQLAVGNPALSNGFRLGVSRGHSQPQLFWDSVIDESLSVTVSCTMGTELPWSLAHFNCVHIQFMCFLNFAHQCLILLNMVLIQVTRKHCDRFY